MLLVIRFVLQRVPEKRSGLAALVLVLRAVERSVGTFALLTLLELLVIHRALRLASAADARERILRS